MIGNRLRRIWAEGRASSNGWLGVGNPFVAEIMAEQGFDSLTIDLQHGALDYAAALPMLQAMRASGVVPLVRVPWREPGIIMKALDAGAYGIVCPMINSGAEARELVRWLRYPPEGDRSFGPTRAVLAAGQDYAAEANREILAFAQIETAEALAAVEEIVATPGLDGIYVGPVDLTLSLSRGALPPALDREEPETIAAFQTILAACKARGLRAALHCGTPDYAARAVGWGFDMVTIAADVALLARAARGSVERFKALTGAGCRRRRSGATEHGVARVRL